MVFLLVIFNFIFYLYDLINFQILIYLCFGLILKKL